MPTRTVAIGSTVGLHARPAAIFVKAAGEAPVPVTIAKAGGSPVPANSMIAIMALGAKHGDEVTLAAEGDGAEGALDELATLLATDLDAEPAS
ncbi:HPr family phosphocarrier protein [uncultured Demequina sp.]|uniref:HPr family phosphocarrier protein n=1 Tax=uncultured Demequina sp. TaxID=693499 RepID=UPI0025CFC59C|nr:HPr family phosphocarrier protein [uncultured Demequina sp.]